MSEKTKDHPNLGSSIESMHPFEEDGGSLDPLEPTPEQFYQTEDTDEVVESCPQCGGTGMVEGLLEDEECPDCGGTGDVISDASMDDEFGPEDFMPLDES